MEDGVGEYGEVGKESWCVGVGRGKKCGWKRK